jgi:hypothetical protein
MTRVLRCRSVMGGLMLGLACGIEQPTAPNTVRTPADPHSAAAAAAAASFGRTGRHLRIQRRTRLSTFDGFVTVIVHDTQQASDGGVAVRWVRALLEWGGLRPFQNPECVNPCRVSCSAENVSLEY